VGQASGGNICRCGEFRFGDTTKKEADIAAFKTPDLCNVLVTASYIHDGTQETLWM